MMIGEFRRKQLMKTYLFISLAIAIQTYRKQGAWEILHDVKWTKRHFIFFPSISFAVVIAKLTMKFLQIEN